MNKGDFLERPLEWLSNLKQDNKYFDNVKEAYSLAIEYKLIPQDTHIFRFEESLYNNKGKILKGQTAIFYINKRPVVFEVMRVSGPTVFIRSLDLKYKTSVSTDLWSKAWKYKLQTS